MVRGTGHGESAASSIKTGNQTRVSVGETMGADESRAERKEVLNREFTQ